MTGNQKIKIISLAFIIMGVALLLYPLFSYTYSVYTQYNLKKNLPGSLNLPLTTEKQPPKKHLPVLPPEDNGNSQKKGGGGKNQEIPVPKPKDALGIIEIPEIDLSAAFVSGTGLSQLRKGPGWYPDTSLPGEPGNMAIAGHRSTYGAWFRHLDRLKKGNIINIIYHNKTFIYEVEKVFVTKKDDWSVVGQTPYPALTLTACHPAGSSRQRLIVRAKLIP